jgi:Ni/Co efflux regulator RcnB
MTQLPSEKPELFKGRHFNHLLIIRAVAGSSIAFAQDGRGRDRDRDDRQDNGRERDGWQDNRRERDDWQDNRRERFEERRGYRDGLIRGREDALEHRRFNPFSSPRFRFGSSDYREGFRSGCAQAYRRFADNYGRHYGRGY